MFKEFKEFVMRGNVMDMAVGIVIGAAFGTIIKSLVADVLMPPIGLLLGGVDFSNMFAVLKEGVEAFIRHAELCRDYGLRILAGSPSLSLDPESARPPAG